MHTMSRAEWLAFSQAGTRTGKLATTRRNGAPHVTPIWFVIDSDPDADYVVFTTHASGLKSKALRRDPRFALVVDDQAPPYSYVLFEGAAELLENPPELLHWATRIGGRYMGEEQADAFGKRNAVPDEFLVRGRITKVTALADVSA